MEMYLNPEQRKEMTVCELARHIFRIIKERGIARIIENNDKFAFRHEDIQALLKRFCERKERHLNGIRGIPEPDDNFCVKFSEAIALLQRRGLLMEMIDRSDRSQRYFRLTSIGINSDFSDGILIIIDDAREIVNSLKNQVPNLDLVVEQYYLESLRACQEGLYISSVISLGAASERAVGCLKEAIVKYDSTHSNLEKKWVSDSVKYILNNINAFNTALGTQLRDDLKEQLELIERIYRLNRNEAGHPRAISISITRCEQENYLNSFRRYAITIFKAVKMLDSASITKTE